MIHALLAERFGQPVKEYRAPRTSRPIADELDDLHAIQQYREEREVAS